MGRRQRLVLIILAAAGALAGQSPQAQPQAQPQARPAADYAEDPVYVRRFSIGATLSVPIQSHIADESVGQLVSTSPRLELESDNTAKKRSIGYGVIAQVMLTERFAAVVNPLLRKMEYTAFTVQYEGTDNPNTAVDERRGTNIEEDTRARLLEVPILVRYYGKDRHDEGHRWFAELGPSLLFPRKVKTERLILHPNQTESLDYTPVSYRKRALGATAGFGARFMDEFGISIVPEVRYTRWLNQAFGSISGRSRRDQVEIMVSLTF